MQVSTVLALLFLLATCGSTYSQKPGEKVEDSVTTTPESPQPTSQPGSVENEVSTSKVSDPITDVSSAEAPSGISTSMPTRPGSDITVSSSYSSTEKTSENPGQKDCEACCSRERLAWLITIIVGSIGAFLLVVVLVLLNVIMCRKNIFVPDKLLVPVTIPISEPPYSKKSVMPIASQAHYAASIARTKSELNSVATSSSSL